MCSDGVSERLGKDQELSQLPVAKDDVTLLSLAAPT